MRITLYHFVKLLVLPVLLWASIAHAAPVKELQTFKNCTLVPQAWADGDSFQIRTEAGELHTIRLYGVDCMEWHVSDDSDARRLRAQRRYFGITDISPKVADSIAMAKAFGEQAATKTNTLLSKKFTIHTRFRKALGDGEHLRFYAFVECHDGSDLATELVVAGLARAYGVFDDGPNDTSAEEYEKSLVDFELQSAKRGNGIWAKTNWDKLPVERKEQRKDEDEDGIAIGNNKLKLGEKINPNTAARDELMKLPGIAEEKANWIIEAREEMEFEKPEDLLRIDGIKIKTLEKFEDYLEFK